MTLPLTVNVRISCQALRTWLGSLDGDQLTLPSTTHGAEGQIARPSKRCGVELDVSCTSRKAQLDCKHTKENSVECTSNNYAFHAESIHHDAENIDKSVVSPGVNFYLAPEGKYYIEINDDDEKLPEENPNTTESESVLNSAPSTQNSPSNIDGMAVVSKSKRKRPSKFMNKDPDNQNVTKEIEEILVPDFTHEIKTSDDNYTVTIDKKTTLENSKYTALSKGTNVEASMPSKSRDDSGGLICEVCGKTLRNYQSLWCHRRVIHKLGKPVNYKVCGECGKQFYMTSAYKRHVAMHTGAKNILCDICGRKFLLKQDLKRHIVFYHEGRDKYHCDLCGHGMNKKRQVLNHKCGRTRKRRRPPVPNVD